MRYLVAQFVEKFKDTRFTQRRKGRKGRKGASLGESAE
jgi:hypothetical protein